MKNTVRLLILTLFVGIVFSISITDIKAQTGVLGGIDEYGEPIPVFWFYISVREQTDRTTGMKSHIIRRLGTRVENGSMEEYKEDLWYNMGKGYKLAMGPFNEYLKAKEAMVFYEITNDSIPLPPNVDVSDKNRTVYYFPVRIFKRERSGSLEFNSSAAAVASGNYEEFYSVIKLQLNFKAINIGPFWSLEEAEAAKSVYKLQ